MYIGIDCGTTAVKVVAFNEDGNELKICSRENNAQYFEDKAEQSMTELWENVLESLEEMFKELGDRRHLVKAIGVTGQGEGLWSLDRDYKPIEPAILWNDGRSHLVVKELKKDLRLYESLKLELGTYLKPGSTLSLLKWMKENNLRRYDETNIIFSCKDWIRYQLSGDIYWELSDATCSNVNLTDKTYAKNAYKALGIEEVIQKMPPMIDSISQSGCLSIDLMQHFDIEHEIPISGGMIDIVATAAGQGAVEENDISIILGTTGMTFTVLNEYTPDLLFNGWETHMMPDQFIKGMGTMAATPNLDWILSILNLDKSKYLNKLDNVLKEFQPFESGVLYHPHISISGERAPFFNELATAQFLGLKQSTTSNELVHSVLEGVVFSIHDCLLDVSDKRSVYVSGGGANSKVWLQILSDCLGVSIKKPKGTELAAKGAAFSAMLMLDNGNTSKEIINRFYESSEIIEPNLDNHKIYQEVFKLYKSTQKEMSMFWEERNKIIGKRVEK